MCVEIVQSLRYLLHFRYTRLDFFDLLNSINLLMSTVCALFGYITLKPAEQCVSKAVSNIEVIKLDHHYVKDNH